MVTAGQDKRRRKGGRSGEQDAEDLQPPVWPGVEGGRYAPLTESELSLVHESVLGLLETLGLSQATPSMVQKVKAHGGTLTKDDRLLFPRDLVMHCINQSNRDIVLHGRRPGLDIDLSGRRVHMSSGGASPSILDLETHQYRDACSYDLFNAARLVDSLENIHHFSRSLVARDAPDNLTMDINTAYASLAGTAKPVSISVTEPENVKIIADICYAIAGSEEWFREKPFVTVMVCHVVPPMRFASEALDTLEQAVLAGFPVQVISAGQAGATSPATIAGSLTQAVAETLAALVFAQLVDANAKVIFAPKPLVADLRTGSMCGGGGEQAILMDAAAQLGRFYNLPTSSIAGITDSKIPDAQHGYEKNLAVSLAAHAGSNLITQACGMQASLLGASLESYVIDNDMLGNILRSVRGVETTVETISADIIAEVCRGEGHYLGHNQTYSRMKTDYYYPTIGDRQSPREWQADGAKDILTRGRKRAKEILKTHYPDHLNDEVDQLLRKKYPILISRKQIGRQQ